MSGKYELIKPLGNGSESQVFLARHLYLDAVCAIKVTPKNCASGQWILAEGKLLKSLNHPGIPQIYDIEEDENYFYLIEEYLNGDSLSERFFHQQVISLTEFYSYALQLCDIFMYLHKATANTCFYQDLKPEHVILCNDTLKLVDFCVSRSTVETAYVSFGNESFSAPEVLSTSAATTQSDVYTLGQFFKYLLDHVAPDNFQTIISILNYATNADPDLRFETVEELRDALLQTELQRKNRTSCTQIALVGSNRGCGVSYIGISLGCVLNKLGFAALYIEQNDSNLLRSMSEHIGTSMSRRDGIYRYHNFIGIPAYGDGIVIEYPKSDFSVFDLTFSNSKLYSSQLIIFIADCSRLHIHDSISGLQSLIPYKERLKVICINEDRNLAKQLARKFSIPVYHFRDSSDAFTITKNKTAFFSKLLNLGKEGKNHP